MEEIENNEQVEEMSLQFLAEIERAQVPLDGYVSNFCEGYEDKMDTVRGILSESYDLKREN